MTKEYITFYSNVLKKNIKAELIEDRKATVKLMLDSGKIIIKKKRMLCQNTN